MAVTAGMAVPDQPEVLYVNTEEGEPYALESLCMNCHQQVRSAMASRSCHAGAMYKSSAQPLAQGTTRLLLTKVPHFRELMIASFECPHCGFRYVAPAPTAPGPMHAGRDNAA